MAQCYIYRTDRSTIKEELQSYFSSGFLCDFKVICGNKSYNIHKLVAAVACRQLWNILENQKDIEILNLSTFDQNEVENFISALYQRAGDSCNISQYSNILKSLNIGDKTMAVDLSSEPLALAFESESNNSIEFDDENNDKNKVIKIENVNEVKANVQTVKKIRGKYNKNGKNKLKFKCDICKNYFGETLLELRNHKTVDHKKVLKNIKNSFSCDLCGEYCGGQRDLRYHIKFSCTKCLIPCSYCPRKFKNKMAASNHITREHSGLENVYKFEKITCEVCSKQVLRYRLKYHMETHDPNAEKWDCSDCGKKFIRLSAKTMHHCNKRNAIVFKDNDGNMMCTLCLLNFKTETLKEINQHRKEIHPENNDVLSMVEYSCPIPYCEVKKHQVNQIKLHLKINHFKVLRVGCGICPERFNHSNSLKKHQSKVHGVNADRLQCDHCGEYFFENYRLKHHIYVRHSNERRFKCKYCSKTFKQNSELGRHLFVHEAKLSKFHCDNCGKKCRDKSTLNAHISKIHKISKL